MLLWRPRLTVNCLGRWRGAWPAHWGRAGLAIKIRRISLASSRNTFNQRRRTEWFGARAVNKTIKLCWWLHAKFEASTGAAGRPVQARLTTHQTVLTDPGPGCPAAEDQVSLHSRQTPLSVRPVSAQGCGQVYGPPGNSNGLFKGLYLRAICCV